jgi:hypothetical protein
MKLMKSQKMELKFGESISCRYSITAMKILSKENFNIFKKILCSTFILQTIQSQMLY